MIKLLGRMKKREWSYALICVVMILGQIYFDLLLPDYMKSLTVLIQTQGSQMSDIWAVGLKMLGVTLASAILTIIGGFLTAQVASGFSFNLRETIFNKVSDFSQREMNRFSVASLITRTTNDINQIQMLVGMGLQILVKAPIMAVWAIIKIINKSWELSLVTAAFVVLIITTMVIVTLIVLPRFKIVQKLIDQINRLTRENLVGTQVVRAFNAQGYQEDKFEQTNNKLMKTQLFNQRTFAVLMPLMYLAMNGLALSIYWVGAILLNNMDPMNVVAKAGFFGDIVTFSTYATYVVMSLMMMVMMIMMLPRAKVSADRINEVINAQSTVIEGEKTEAFETGTVEFQNVSFHYPDSEENVLKNISFKVKKGETIAFIGATGSGKTTLVSLAARFYDATQGKVLVDGVDVKEFTFEALYNRIGYVTQKAVLFSGTVRENVDFGESSEAVTQDDVRSALTLAQGMDFVSQMRGEIEASIAQGGTNVSGGQKQRLSIARALARKPEILIFDDSFSALDYKTDAALRAGLARELKGTTNMIVAQRIGTIRHADTIVVLDEGEAVGIGTHEELLENCSVYREIAMSQLSPEELVS
ncbi:MAG: ABC transporter ATP-binding protein [Clostridiales bacterium]|nr:ABC transporter ATP-binding protein [Clostridiales bacterium]